MSEAFERYELEYRQLSQNLSKNFTSSTLLDEEQRKQKLSEVKAGVDNAESLIKAMDLEARNLQPNVKAVLLAKLREYKSDIDHLKSEAKLVKSPSSNQAARDDELLEESADQDAKAILSTESQDNCRDRIRESGKTMLETEELSVSIHQDLDTPWQPLLHAHNTLHSVDDGTIEGSKRILTSILRGMSRNKWMISALVAILILVIVLIFYFQFSK